MDGFWVRYVSLWISISNWIWIFELNSVCNAWWFLRFSRFEWYSVEYAICLWWRQPIHFKPQNASTIACAVCHISTTFAQRKSTDVMKWEKKRPLKLETVCLNYAMPAAVIQRHYFPLKVDPNLFIFLFLLFISFGFAFSILFVSCFSFRRDKLLSQPVIDLYISLVENISSGCRFNVNNLK